MNVKERLITLKSPEASAKNTIGAVGVLAGFSMAVLGAILMVTIIGLLPGIGLLLTGSLIIYLSSPKVATNCPACDKEIKAIYPFEKTKCDRCDTKIPVEWEKRKKKDPA